MLLCGVLASDAFEPIPEHCGMVILTRRPELGWGISCACGRFHTLKELDSWAEHAEFQRKTDIMLGRVKVHKCRVCKKKYELARNARRCETKAVEKAICKQGDRITVDVESDWGSYTKEVEIGYIEIQAGTHRIVYHFSLDEVTWRQGIYADKDGKLKVDRTGTLMALADD